MALREDPASLNPEIFDDTMDKNLIPVQEFTDKFITKILKEEDCSAKVMWEMPMIEDENRHTLHFEILRYGSVLCYGAISSRDTVDEMKVIASRRLHEEVLRPRSRNVGYISAIEKTGGGLKIGFARVHRVEEGEPDVQPALVDLNTSTIYLDESLPLQGPEAAFRAFLAACIKDFPVVTS